MQAPLQAKNDSAAAQTKTARTAPQERRLVDNRPAAVAQSKMAEMMNNSPRVFQQRALSDAVRNSPRMVAQRHKMNALFGGAVKPQGDGTVPAEASPTQREKKTNNTGLPNQLKSGIESLSGMSMDHVKVHYNSDKPAQLQAHAYAQGNEIHLGAGQERHLPHEAWHVVQQAQGRVRPTLQMKAGAVNDDPSLEKEADMMGKRAAQFEGDQVARDLAAEERLGAVTKHVAGFAQCRTYSQTIAPASLASAAPSAIAQLVRTRIKGANGDAISLESLAVVLAAIEAEIAQIDDEEANGLIDLGKIGTWESDYVKARAEAEHSVPDAESFTWTQIDAAATAGTKAMRKMVIALSNIGKALNESLTKQEVIAAEFAAFQEDQDSFAGKAPTPAASSKKDPVLTPTKHGPIGLQNKWGPYRKKLQALSGNVRFVQSVPADAATIAKATASQNILDAVYNENKAFWLAAESGDYRKSAPAGYVNMIYTFSSEGATSLMHDHLICGSGDFADDNEEKWEGETAHPKYTIWKTNEIGAFGVGSQRLKALALECKKIEGPK